MSLALNRPATLEQLRRHNRVAVMRALYRGEAQSRSQLALVTGLTKPTVSTLVAELIAEGLVSERGLGRASGSGGKRPTLLRFEPGARQVIGVTVGDGRALGVLSDLGGEVYAMHVTELDGDATAAVLAVVAGLRAQLDAPLECVGVGLPGAVPAPLDPEAAAGATGTYAEPLMLETLMANVGVPMHIAGRAELGALGQLAYGGGASGTLVSLVVDEGVEVGVCLARGTVHYGSELTALASGLSWPAVRDGAVAILPDAEENDPPRALCLELRTAAARGDAGAERLRSDLANRLGVVLAWLVATLRPSQVALGGPLAELGTPFLELLKLKAADHLPAEQLAAVDLTVVYTQQFSAMGAVALAVQHELELLFT